MAKKRKVGKWILIGIISLILALLLGSLAFVGITIYSLDSSMETKKGEVVEAYKAREGVIEELTGLLENRMPGEGNYFKNISNAENKLNEADTVDALSKANIELDQALDNLKALILDKYVYLENEKVMEVEEDLESANSRIVIECSDYNDDAKEYNFVVENFPGNILSSIFGLEKAETFEIINKF